ncbi:hypothetical protein M5K25_026846 [Dendrobium thyrsiflorum]|uniref:Uncharacterized protein n=1 Tax=Dendrobium thyrsiflorum TaxID=117978 RepID=A0ABD0TYL8_DENTH
MAKQKVVLKLSMEDAKKRAKAMKCAVGMHGVLSVSHEGDKMTVVGQGIDSVTLTRLLRKKMGCVELEVVTPVEKKKEEKEKEKEEKGKSNIFFFWEKFGLRRILSKKRITKQLKERKKNRWKPNKKG